MSAPAPAGLGRPFWVTWIAATISLIGDGLTIGALPLLAASLTRDPRLVSLTDAVTSLGWLLLGLLSGVVVDRYARLVLMWQVDAIRTVIAAVFAAVVLAGHASIPLLLLTGLLLGLAAPFFDNASSAVLPELVEPVDLERANSLSQGSMVVAGTLIGPPLGAFLFVRSHGLPLAIDAVSFGLASLLVAVLARGGGARRPTRPATGVLDGPPAGETAAAVAELTPAPEAVQNGTAAADTGFTQRSDQDDERPRHWRAELMEGLRYLWRHPVLRPLALVLTAINGVTGGVVGVLVLYSLEVLRLPPVAYGWLITTYAVGGLIGALTSSWLSRRFGVVRCVSVSAVLFGVTVLLMGVLPSLFVVLPCLAIVGLASTLWGVMTIAYRQREVPAALLGRVTSVYRMIGFLAIPVGAAGSGLIAHLIGIRTTYALGGLVLLVAAVLGLGPIRLMEPGAAAAETS